MKAIFIIIIISALAYGAYSLLLGSMDFSVESPMKYRSNIVNYVNEQLSPYQLGLSEDTSSWKAKESFITSSKPDKDKPALQLMKIKIVGEYQPKGASGKAKEFSHKITLLAEKSGAQELIIRELVDY